MTRLEFEQVRDTLAGIGGVGSVSLFYLIPAPYLELSGLLIGALMLAYLRRSVSWSDRLYYSVASLAFGALIAHALAGAAATRFDAGPHWFPLIGGCSVLIALPFVELLRGIGRRIQGKPDPFVDWIVRKLGGRPGGQGGGDAGPE